MKHLQAVALALMLIVGLAGCGAAESEAAPTAQPTAAPTATPTPTPHPVGNPLTGEADDYTGKRPVAVALRTGDGAAPQWGIAAADVLIEGVTRGGTPSLTAVYADVDGISKAGPVDANSDLMLQMTLPLNAVPVSIDKSVYASNLLNLLSYQDLDGYHIGTAGFAFDEERKNAGYNEENCWYTTADLIKNGLASYGASTDGDNMTLFYFAQRPAAETHNATQLMITFSDTKTETLVYSPDTGLYLKNNFDGTPTMDADNGDQAAFTNVLVLYASSGVKDDGITRQYDMTGGTGIYLTGGAWEQINWTKGDATAPLSLTDMSGSTLSVNPGKSYIAIWGGYYGQHLSLLAEDSTQQTLPEKPTLLESGIPDDVAAAAAEEIKRQQDISAAQQALADAQQALAEAQQALSAAVQAQSEALATATTDDDTTTAEQVVTAQQAAEQAQAAVDTAQAALDALVPPTEAAEGEATAEGDAAEQTPAADAAAEAAAAADAAPAATPDPAAATPAPEPTAEATAAPAATPAPAEAAQPTAAPAA